MTWPSNPFVGLRPFESEEALLFFGRQKQTVELLQRLHTRKFLSVIGSSGCGKSSLIRAGLIPKLKAGMLVEDRDRWFIAAMKPGGSPLDNLVLALHRGFPGELRTDDVQNLRQHLDEAGVDAILETFHKPLDDSNANLLLLIDQFEEIFRFCLQSGDERLQEEAFDFVALMLDLADSTLPFYTVMTMRSDFLGDCDTFLRLPEAMNQGQYLVPRLGRKEQREAIEGPIRLYGKSITPRLTDRLLNDLSAESDQLPVIQHALMRLWEKARKESSDELDILQYQSIGTIQQALSIHADEALACMCLDDFIIAEKIFKALTDTDSANRRIRRPAYLNDVAEICRVKAQQVLPTIKKFQEDRRNFLFVTSESPAKNPLVDISHESLIRQWQTLSDWVDEEAESATIFRRLAESAALNKQKKAGLLREADLHVALEWRKYQGPTEAWAKRYHPGFQQAMEFLDQSRAARNAEIRQQREQQQERERLLLEKNRQQHRALRQSRIIIVMISLFSIVLGFTAWYAVDRQQEVRRRTEHANFINARLYEDKVKNALQEAILKNDSSFYQKAWLYAAAALSQHLGEDKRALTPDTVGRLFSRDVISKAFGLRWFSPSTFKASLPFVPSSAVALTPDGKTFAYASLNAELHPIVDLKDIASGKSITHLEISAQNVLSIAVDPDGKTIAIGTEENTIRLYAASDWKLMQVISSGLESINSIAFNGVGNVLAAGSATGKIQLIHLVDGKGFAILESPRAKETILSVAFSPDGKTLAAGSNHSIIQLWDLQGENQPRELETFSEGVHSIAFSPDGGTLAAGLADSTIRFWEVPSNREIARIKLHSDIVQSVVFSPDGTTLVSWSTDRIIRSWELPVTEGVTSLGSSSRTVFSVAFSADGQSLVSGEYPSNVALWDIAKGEGKYITENHIGHVYSVAFSPNSKKIASASQDATIQLFDRINEQKKKLAEHESIVWSLAFSPDGSKLASGGDDSTVRLWDAESGVELEVLPSKSGAVYSVAFSRPDGKLLASGTEDFVVRLWDMVKKEESPGLTGHAGRVMSVVFSPDGNTLVSGAKDATIRLWDRRTKKEIRVLKGHTEGVTSVAFSPDGKTLASGADDSSIRLWDVRDVRSDSITREIASLSAKTKIRSIAFRPPDGRVLATAAENSTIRLWDVSYLLLFADYEKNSGLWNEFLAAIEFLWEYELVDGRSVEPKKRNYGLKAADGYFFDYDSKFRPLLERPASSESKFMQIIDWAHEQSRKK